MTDSYSLCEIGGSELARHYTDRGPIPDSHWYDAILAVETDADGLWGKLNRLSAATHRFGAVLSGNSEGLRIVVSSEQFAAFVPWSEAEVSAERGVPATVVRLRASAVGSACLVLHVDDAAADDLLRAVLGPLPRRDPPGRLLRLRPWALGVLVIAMLALARWLASLRLSWLEFVAAVVVASVLMVLGLAVLKPLIEEKP
jgi:hypothetical protein